MRPLRVRAVEALALPGVIAFGLVSLPPLLAVATLLATAGGSETSVAEIPGARLWWHSMAWAVSIAIAAALVGWPLGRVLRGGAPWVWAAVVAAAIVPAWATFYCWWRVLRPGNPIADAAIRGDWVGSLREMGLALSLLTWTWPLVAVAVALRPSPREAATRDLLALESPRWRDRVAASWRGDRGTLAFGALVIVAMLLGETTSFDVAQTLTVASELRAMDAAGAAPRAVIAAGGPALAVGVIAVALSFGMLMRALPRVRPAAADEGGSPPRRGTPIALVVLVFTVLPIALLTIEMAGSSQQRTFTQIHARGAVHSLVMAAVAGGICAAMALGAAVMAILSRRVVLTVAAILCAILLTLPATLLAVAEVDLWRRTPFIYDTVAIVALAEAGRFSVVAIVVGAWCGMAVGNESREDWEVHGGGTLDFIRMAGPGLAAAMAGGFLLVFALAISETSIAARLEPPGADWLAASLLNAIHYQDPSAVCAALPWLVGVAGACAALAVWVLRCARRGIRLGSIALFILAVLPMACGGSTDPTAGNARDATTPLPVDRIIGRAGHTDGRFYIPRAMAVEPSTGCLFVIDKDARVQRFAADGRFEIGWRMPRFDRGKPTGISISPEGSVYVADTHEKRILVFDRDGVRLSEFGSFGTGPGEFIYPCDVAFSPQGEIYVSEYGGNDRIQVFSRDHQFLRQFGGPGTEPGQFARPQSIALSGDGGELFVADSCNHRIQVFTPTGTLLRTLGHAGREGGEFAYPYGVHVLQDGSLLVAEFGNCRLQRIDSSDGHSLGCFGGGGVEQGRLNAPWAVDEDRGRVFVLDSANARVQSMPLESLR